ncbi:hypothetical protein [Aliidiomarina soli]|uniref:Uncharacterized protein n=1 Tax=Aliidiomarina soli TaxID=1928574 RepID=A0A432WCP9_9GAMM|nr:hypothetical protein [Aliidiomarina soli]RUO29542.1 hypothetical protein CWE14_13850 [Aliidiomarina soli]
MDSNLFPITVIAAISLFLIKEMVELYRRIMADKRKSSAIKRLLSSEIEKNNWVIKSLRRHLRSVQDGWHESEFVVVSTHQSGYRIEEKRNDGGSGYSPLFQVSTTVFDKVVFELPVLDEALFKLAENAYESLAEVKHVSNSLVEHITNKDDHIAHDFMAGFCEYALEEIDEAYEHLSILYKKCTGKELKSHKLRSYT